MSVTPKIYGKEAMFMREQVGSCELEDGTEVEVCRNVLGLGIIVRIKDVTYVYSESDMMNDAIQRYKAGETNATNKC